MTDYEERINEELQNLHGMAISRDSHAPYKIAVTLLQILGEEDIDPYGTREGVFGKEQKCVDLSDHFEDCEPFDYEKPESEYKFTEGDVVRVEDAPAHKYEVISVDEEWELLKLADVQHMRQNIVKTFDEVEKKT